jgi:hypothetical protein
MTPDQKQRRYDYLLALPHLWPEQVEELRQLSVELCRPVRFYRLELNNQPAGWLEENHD